jgi:gas vesicle protein
LAVGKVPFDDQSLTALHSKIKRGLVHYALDLSPEVRHLLASLLVVNPSRRATMDFVQSHKFFLKDKMLDGLGTQLFRSKSKLNKYPINIKREYQIEDLDPLVLNEMAKFGFYDRQKCKMLITEKTSNAAASIYSLISDHLIDFSESPDYSGSPDYSRSKISKRFTKLKTSFKNAPTSLEKKISDRSQKTKDSLKKQIENINEKVKKVANSMSDKFPPRSQFRSELRNSLRKPVARSTSSINRATHLKHSFSSIFRNRRKSFAPEVISDSDYFSDQEESSGWFKKRRRTAFVTFN